MTRIPGRPQVTAINSALILAAHDILTEGGYEALNVEALVKRAGTTRPAFYRRYADIGSLALELLLGQFEIDLEKLFDTGDLRGDLMAIQWDQLEFFSHPLISRAMPGFLATLRSDDELRASFVEKFLSPRRQATGLILERAALRGEISDEFDTDWICDLLTGPFVFRVQIPEAGPIDDSLVNSTVTAAVSALQCSPNQVE